MTVTTHQAIRGYTAGPWIVDPAHSSIGFSVRHTMTGKVRGKFTAFNDQIIVGETPSDSRGLLHWPKVAAWGEGDAMKPRRYRPVPAVSS